MHELTLLTMYPEAASAGARPLAREVPSVIEVALQHGCFARADLEVTYDVDGSRDMRQWSCTADGIVHLRETFCSSKGNQKTLYYSSVPLA